MFDAAIQIRVLLAMRIQQSRKQLIVGHKGIMQLTSNLSIWENLLD